MLSLPALDIEHRVALVLVQTGEDPANAVREAHALALDRQRPLRLEVEPPEVLRLLLYAETLDALNIEAGVLRAPASDAGRDLPEPSQSFVTSVGADPRWEAVDPALAPAIPWQLPRPVRPSLCDEVQARTWALADYSLVQPLTMVALSDEQVIIGGYHTEGDGRTIVESLLIAVDGLGSEPRVRVLGTPWAGDIVESLVHDGAGAVVGTTRLGRVFRLEAGSLERVEVASPLEPGRSWRLARGVDGTLVVYDGTPPPPGSTDIGTRPAQRLDPESLSWSPFASPEPPSELVVHTAARIVATGGGRLYLWDGTDWRREAQTEPGIRVTDLAVDARGERFMALISQTFVWERLPDGSWTPLPPLPGTFGITESLFISAHDFFVGGGAGIYTIWDGETWCESRARPISRDLRAVFKAPGGRHVFAVTYSESASESLILARFTFP